MAKRSEHSEFDDDTAPRREELTRVTQIHAPPRGPVANEPACLVLIYPPGADLGKRYALDEVSELTIGRAAECSIQVDRDSVSRRHAKLDRASGSIGVMWQVQDLGSTNGTFVNDQQISQRVLRDGDLLKIGSAIFKFLVGGNIESSYHEEIYRMTIMDGLTGVYNKRYFLETIEKEIPRCSRHGRPVSLLMFDIDHFKRINDGHGHLAGDFVLCEMARRVRGRVRKEEVFARYGGEEFAILLPETTHAQALKVGEDVRLLVAAAPFEFDGERIPVTISVGVHTISNEVEPEAFIAIADENLYRAKRGGRNRVVG